MLKGYNKIGSRLDTHLPITLPILRQIMCAAPSVATTPYECVMFRAMCATAFFAFLRIGEITATSQNSETLHLNQLGKLTDNSGTVISYELTFQDFQHHYNQLSTVNNTCPVQALLDYISVRGTTAGSLFQTFDGSPVLGSVFSDLLSLAVRHCGLDPTKYKGHSFRIGAASHAAGRGSSDSQIRLLGHWKSNAFRNYIRVPSLDFLNVGWGGTAPANRFSTVLGITATGVSVILGAYLSAFPAVGLSRGYALTSPRPSFSFKSICPQTVAEALLCCVFPSSCYFNVTIYGLHDVSLFSNALNARGFLLCISSFYGRGRVLASILNLLSCWGGVASFTQGYLWRLFDFPPWLGNILIFRLQFVYY